MIYMFHGAGGFTGTGLDKWDVHLVNNFEYMFWSAHKLNNPDIKLWDVSSTEPGKFFFFLCDANAFENHLCEDNASPTWTTAGYCIDGKPQNLAIKLN